jgi:phosphoenolpyruvate-protein phosphotransferase (PTS system enzyme I)
MNRRDTQSHSASFTLHGARVGEGIAIGYAHLFSTARLEVAHYQVTDDDVEAELYRLDRAFEQVRGELRALQDGLPPGTPPEMGAFLRLHAMILDDSNLALAPRELVRRHRYNAERALVQQMDELVAQFDRMEDPYLRERGQDVVQVVERVLKAMQGTGHAPAAPAHEENVIVVAHDLSPADMIIFKQHQYAGFVTDLGGATSHTAIVARSLNIPAIVGLRHARATVRENDLLIVDGTHGVLMVNPGELVLEEYRRLQATLGEERRKLKGLRTTRAATLDGTRIQLHANIELPKDVEDAQEVGAAGIGLFRTEFLFLNRDNLPAEDEQFEAYRAVAQAMAGRPVTIRSLDLGADKSINGSRAGPNPALGLRAIRFCLAEPQIFLTQLRAILRASHYGKVRLLVPMLAHAHEVEQALQAVRQAKATLDEEGVPYDAAVKIGGMIEVPAAALSLRYLISKLDFLSIGTNDLIQYTLAIDRTDDTVAHLYDPLHPAVLHLIAHTIRMASRVKMPVAVCGEMAGDPSVTRLLLGFGLREFSMHPAQLLAVKQQVLTTRIADVEALAHRIGRTHDPEQARELLSRLNG